MLLALHLQEVSRCLAIRGCLGRLVGQTGGLILQEAQRLPLGDIPQPERTQEVDDGLARHAAVTSCGQDGLLFPDQGGQVFLAHCSAFQQSRQRSLVELGVALRREKISFCWWQPGQWPVPTKNSILVRRASWWPSRL